jgi:lipopolysaccharide export LptBFGC system permease protein LptF
MREEEHLKRVKAREGMKIGGLVCVAVGVAMVIFLKAMTATDPGAPYLVGLIPGLVGVALLVYVFFMAGPVE